MIRRCWLSFLLLAGTTQATTATTDEAWLVDISRAEAGDIERWRNGAGVRWWLELGDDLLLAGDPSAIAGTHEPQRRMQRLGSLQPSELVLHARGCGDVEATNDLLVASVGRYELLRRPDAARMAAMHAQDAAHLGAPEWIDVQPNTVLARQFRVDAKRQRAPDPLIQPLVDAIDAERWFDDVTTLAGWSRSTYSTELPIARGRIAAQFAALGLKVSEPTFTVTYNGTPYSPANVIGKLAGTTRPDDWIIVGGHYDSRNINYTPAARTTTRRPTRLPISVRGREPSVAQSSA